MESSNDNSKLESAIDALSNFFRDLYDKIIEKRRVSVIEKINCMPVPIGKYIINYDKEFHWIEEPHGSYCPWSKKYYDPAKNLKCEHLDLQLIKGPFYGCSKKIDNEKSDIKNF